MPLVGDKPLNEISTEDIQKVKSALIGRSPKTVNNVLTVLSVAGHQDLTTTQRHMHLTLAALEAAIRLLDSPWRNDEGGRKSAVHLPIS